MPHVVIEYTRNLEAEGDIPALLSEIGDVLMAQKVYPVGGIKIRAIGYDQYRMADGKADDAMVHCTMTIGAGRSAEVIKATKEAVFDTMKGHFAALFDTRYLGLSLELREFDEGGTMKHNNIHTRFR